MGCQNRARHLPLGLLRKTSWNTQTKAGPRLRRSTLARPHGGPLPSRASEDISNRRENQRTSSQITLTERSERYVPWIQSSIPSIQGPEKQGLHRHTRNKVRR